MDEKNKAQAAIQKLVENFQSREKELLKKEYTETPVRREFIDPLFEALGWDISNEANLSQKKREVILEYPQERTEKDGSSSRKKPDYAFRLNGKVKFFVEAKAPWVPLDTAEDPIQQVRAYGYHGGLAVSVLTDFQELYVYDTRINLKKKTSPLLSFKYTEYISRFDELWDALSKEAVMSSESQFATWQGKLSSSAYEKYTINYEFLDYLKQFREGLAKNIANRNNFKSENSMDEYDFNYIVQKIIDRIIFLRIAEARGLEYENNLRTLANQAGAYQALNAHFAKCIKRYNSDLFSNKDDKLLGSLIIDDKVFKDYIVKGLYDECSFRFEFIPVEILGAIYEQFLGDSIRVTNSGQVKVEEKPEVKKAGGVFYTPQYIVDNIVENTVGEKLKNQKPATCSLKVVDPACGSGAFLLGAYDYLLDWYLEQYTAGDSITKRALKEEKIVFNRADERHYLNLAERKRILLDHIHGVDIDQQAVEMTKLSLVLKMMEDASPENEIFHITDKVSLPDLSQNNIKCGNSLLSDDVLEGHLSYSRPERKKLNLFNWEAEFKPIFDRGGFDCVIGNPPYIRIQTMSAYTPLTPPLLKDHFDSAKDGNIDIYLCFVEQGLKRLLNPAGLLGFILPHKFFEGDMGENLRLMISTQKALRRVVYFGANQVFPQATTYTCLLFLSKAPQDNFELLRFYKDAPLEYSLGQENFMRLPAPAAGKDTWNFHPEAVTHLLNKLKAMPLKLNDITRKIFVGLQTSADDIYVLEERESTKDYVKAYSKSLDRVVELEHGIMKPFLLGKDVRRYEPPHCQRWVLFPYKKNRNNEIILLSQQEIQELYPKAWAYIEAHKKTLQDREYGRFKKEYWQYGRPQNLLEFENQKISIPYMSNQTQCTWDDRGLFHGTKIYSLSLNQNTPHNPMFLLGIMNSPLFWFFISNIGTVFSGWFYVFSPNFIGQFPIAEASPAQQAELAALVRSRLDLEKEFPDKAALSPSKLKDYKTDARILEGKINKIVYGLYGLDKDEIRAIEA